MLFQGHLFWKCLHRNTSACQRVRVYWVIIALNLHEKRGAKSPRCSLCCPQYPVPISRWNSLYVWIVHNPGALPRAQWTKKGGTLAVLPCVMGRLLPFTHLSHSKGYNFSRVHTPRETRKARNWWAEMSLGGCSMGCRVAGTPFACVSGAVSYGMPPPSSTHPSHSWSSPGKMPMGQEGVSVVGIGEGRPLLPRRVCTSSVTLLIAGLEPAAHTDGKRLHQSTYFRKIPNISFKKLGNKKICTTVTFLLQEGGTSWFQVSIGLLPTSSLGLCYIPPERLNMPISHHKDHIQPSDLCGYQHCSCFLLLGMLWMHAEPRALHHHGPPAVCPHGTVPWQGHLDALASNGPSMLLYGEDCPLTLGFWSGELLVFTRNILRGGLINKNIWSSWNENFKTRIRKFSGPPQGKLKKLHFLQNKVLKT